MANWTVKQVTDWLKENGFKKQRKIFKNKNIDGNTLMRLTENEISQLFMEVTEDGTIQEPTIGIKSRFRVQLIEWKMSNNIEIANESPIVIPTNVTNKDKHQEDKVPEKLKKKDSDNVKRKTTYLIDDDIQIRFFKNEKFLQYFINYIKQETFPIDIEITKLDSNNDQLFYGYTIKLIGTKQQYRVVRSFIKHFLATIKCKTYDQKEIQNWSFKSKQIDIIQNILNNESDLFTISRFINRILEIYYFEDKKFNSSENVLVKIDNIIQNQICQENILWSKLENRHHIEFIDFITRETLLKYQICVTEKFSEEFEEILKPYIQDDPFISFTGIAYDRYKPLTKRPVEIFGDRKLVNEVLQKFKDLFDKHRLRKFQLSQLSSAELDCLANLCSTALRYIEIEFRNGCVEIRIQKNEFYAPLCLKDEIRSRIKNLSSQIKSKTFKNIELYYNTSEKLCLHIKNIAQRNQNYCQITSKTKLKSYQIPRGHENTSNTPKSIIEQSDLFYSSPSVFCQANGSIEILIGDIALQKVDVIIIPSISFGLKESLIERAGDLIPKESLNENTSIPFITETTGGKLNCQKILFVNWSLPMMKTNDDDLSESVRRFISKSIEYIRKDNQQSNSIAFAVPDLCIEEEILAEEMIEETIHLTKSLSLKVSFVLLADQQTLYKQFLNVIQRVNKGEENFGLFYCPTSTITITLMSFDDDYLKKCEEKLKNYLKRSMFKMKLDGYSQWSQYMINAFYKYSIDRYVLPRIDNQQQMILYGPINNVYEVNQKYQLINALIQEKINTSSIDYKIMLSYSHKDSIISHRIANRLIDEGFSVWINSNQSDQIFEKMNQSDSIILCISKNYFEDQLCEKEAKYAEQIGKNIIPIKIEYYQPIEWLQKLIEKESYFQLFGSDNHFNFEYEKLLLKIFQYTKSGYVSPLEQTSNVLQEDGIAKSVQKNSGLYFLLTSEERKLKYEKNVKKLMKLERGKISEDDKEDLSGKLQAILHIKEKQCQKYLLKDRPVWLRGMHRHLPREDNPDYQRKEDELIQNIRFSLGIISYQQWLDKLGNLKTKFNLAPFTFTGDINDATFPLLNEVLRNPNLLFSLRRYYSLPPKSYSSSEGKETSKTVERSSVDSGTSNDKNMIKYKTVNGFKEEKKQRKIIREKSSSSESLFLQSKKPPSPKRSFSQRKKAPSPKSSFSQSKKLEFQSKFAEQMQKNEDQFQKFCEDHQHSSQTLRKRKTRANPTAIFGPSAFSNIKIEPRQTLPPRNKIELPLKFPWNGVFDTKIHPITWENSSVFFFFEATLSEEH